MFFYTIWDTGMTMDRLGCDCNDGCADCDPFLDNGRSVYFFHKKNCVPCTRVKPLMEQLEKEGLPVAWYDAEVVKEEDPDLLTRLKVLSVPCVVIVDHLGQRVAGWTGGMIQRASIVRLMARED